MQNDRRIDGFGYNVPERCTECSSDKIKYLGVGEYKCEDCGTLMYDDYGKVRNYIEANQGATTSEVSKATGVSTDKIRRLLRDDKIEIAPGSVSFLTCDKCGKEIRSGRLCDSCSKEKSKFEAAKALAARSCGVSGGFGKSVRGDSGAKRFSR